MLRTKQVFLWLRCLGWSSSVHNILLAFPCLKVRQQHLLYVLVLSLVTRNPRWPPDTSGSVIPVDSCLPQCWKPQWCLGPDLGTKGCRLSGVYDLVFHHSDFEKGRDRDTLELIMVASLWSKSLTLTLSDFSREATSLGNESWPAA